jgi:hypothetical protein
MEQPKRPDEVDKYCILLERAMGIEPNALSRSINLIMLIRLPLHP